MNTGIMAGVILFSAIYGFFLLALTAGLFARYSRWNRKQPLVTVVVAARNEEASVGACLDSLLAQTYPESLIEIVAVDDASADRTAENILRKSEPCSRIRLLRQSGPQRGLAPKKNAITKGVAVSRGELIFTLDADSVARPDWVETMVRYFTPETGVVFGWVRTGNGRGIFGKVQELDYLGIVGVAAGFAGLGIPTMGNANNMAFRKQAFEEVNGYAGIDHVQSGDDELLIQKIHDHTGWKTAFCADPEAMNTTAPCNSVKAFLNQRMRWGSKGRIYDRFWLRILLPCLFLFYMTFWGCVAGTWIGGKYAMGALSLFCFKCLADLPLTVWCLGKTRRWGLAPYYLIAEIFQIFYIPLCALGGTLGLYRWKK